MHWNRVSHAIRPRILPYRVHTSGYGSHVTAGIDLESKYPDIERIVTKRFGSQIREIGWSLDECLQDIYVRILTRNNSPSAFNPARGKFITYVLLVSWTYISNRKRDEKAERALFSPYNPLNDEDELDMQSDPQLPSEAEVAEIFEALEPETQQLLRYYRDGLNREQIASRLGICEDAVTRLRKAAIRQILALRKTA